MKHGAFLQLALCLVFYGCAAQPTSAVLPSGRISDAQSRTTGDAANPEAGQTGTEPRDGSNSDSNSEPGKAGKIQPYTLAEAKEFCVGCHAEGASDAGKWNKAGGTEAEWKTDAAKVRSAVEFNGMPVGKSNFDKNRFFAFLDQLTGALPAGGSSSGSGSGGNTGPASTMLTFATAKVYCIGCHNATPSNPDSPTARSARGELALSDSDPTDWAKKKSKIIGAVNSSNKPMPPPKGISDTVAKKAFVDFVNSLQP